MRTLIVFVSLAMLPIIAGAQTKADYQQKMAKFVKFYNNKQGDSIVNLWQVKDRSSITDLWKPEAINKLHNAYGTISSFKFVKMVAGDAPGAEFQTIFSKLEPNGTGMLLDNKKYISTFVLITKEPIDKKTKKTAQY